ncbi:hypothetical protein ACWCXC_17140 [Streptomyces sp. NPDC001515]
MDRNRAPGAPASLTEETRLLLGRLADHLDTRRPHALMLEPIRLARALVLAEQLHGPTEQAYAAEQALLAAAPPVDHDQTRAQYAALLRTIAAEGAGR